MLFILQIWQYRMKLLQKEPCVDGVVCQKAGQTAKSQSLEVEKSTVIFENPNFLITLMYYRVGQE